MFGLDHLLDEMIDIYASHFSSYDDNEEYNSMPMDILDIEKYGSSGRSDTLNQFLGYDHRILTQPGADEKLTKSIISKIDEIEKEFGGLMILEQKDAKIDETSKMIALDCMKHILKINYIYVTKNNNGNRSVFSNQDEFLNYALDFDNIEKDDDITKDSKNATKLRIMNALDIMKKIFIVFRRMMQLNQIYIDKVINEHISLLNLMVEQRNDDGVTQKIMDEMDKLFKQLGSDSFFKTNLFEGQI